jgi:hypothetical protein
MVNKTEYTKDWATRIHSKLGKYIQVMSSSWSTSGYLRVTFGKMGLNVMTKDENVTTTNGTYPFSSAAHILYWLTKP